MWPVIKAKYSAGKRALNSENRRIYQITPYILQSGKTKVRIRFSIPENPLVQIPNMGEFLDDPTGYILYEPGTSHSGLSLAGHRRLAGGASFSVPGHPIKSYVSALPSERGERFGHGAWLVTK